MILVNNYKFATINNLYSFNKLNLPQKDIFKDIEIEDFLSIDETIVLFNPNYKDLKLLTSLKKTLVLIFSYVDEDLLPLLKNENIVKIIVFDELDNLFLTKNKIVAELVFPSIDKIDTNNETYRYFSIFNDIKDVNMSSLQSFIKENKITFFGYKTITSHNDYEKIIKLLDLKIKIVPFPILDLFDKLARFKFTINFYNKHFPIVAFYSILCGKLPLMIGPREYRWLLPELLNPTEIFLNKIDNDNAFYDSLVKTQSERFLEVFGNRKKIEEVFNGIK